MSMGLVNFVRAFCFLEREGFCFWVVLILGCVSERGREERGEELRLGGKFV
jgi:hypothetical protein